MKNKISEQELVNLIKQWLQLHGWWVLRLNSGMIKTLKGVVRLSPAGTPDLFALKKGKCVFIEVKIGKKASTAHTHSCGIYHGLYVAGTSSKLTTEWDYTSGPTSWSHSHVVQYSNGQRAIVTMKIVEGVAKWRA